MKPISMHKCDIIVIGASLEGCIAAVTAAQKKKKVLLVEKSGSLGQASTNGLYVYLPNQQNMTEEVREYSERIRLILDAGAGNGKPLYHDQRLKLALQNLLDKAEVQVLTHTFPVEPILSDNQLKGFRFGAKTGYIDAMANTIIDATDQMEAGGAIGLSFQQKSLKIQTNVKMNQIPTEDIRAHMKEIIEEGEAYLIGKLNYEFNGNKGGMSCVIKDPIFYHDSEVRELIITGLTALPQDMSAFSLSKAQSGLRTFAYDVRDDLRKNKIGFQNAHIIHVAPRIDCYGIRCTDHNPYSNLILVNNKVIDYCNSKAIELGINAGRGCN